MRAGLSIATLAISLTSCGHDRDPGARPVRFVHTFSPPEAAALDDLLAGGADRVELTLLPFSRGEAVLGAALRKPSDCPDLIRLDATWLPALADDGLLRAPPPELVDRDWLPEAATLATWRGALAAAPMSLDGLVLVRSDAGPPPPAPWPPTTLDAVIGAARAVAGPERHGLGLRVDGYWLVPFLRARGADVADGAQRTLGIDGAGAEQALVEMAALFTTGLAAPPPAPGGEATSEADRFQRGAIAILATGPWAFPELATPGPDGLGGIVVDPWPGAPRGAQLLAVPACAREPERAWQLAATLTAPATQAAWSRRLGTVPTTVRGLAAAGPLARQAFAALATARPLPRHRLSAALFDDLTPAVAAVVAGDATAAEAIAGVRRAWARALEASPR